MFAYLGLASFALFGSAAAGDSLTFVKDNMFGSCCKVQNKFCCAEFNSTPSCITLKAIYSSINCLLDQTCKNAGFTPLRPATFGAGSESNKNAKLAEYFRQAIYFVPAEVYNEYYDALHCAVPDYVRCYRIIVSIFDACYGREEEFVTIINTFNQKHCASVPSHLSISYITFFVKCGNTFEFFCVSRSAKIIRHRTTTAYTYCLPLDIIDIRKCCTYSIGFHHTVLVSMRMFVREDIRALIAIWEKCYAKHCGSYKGCANIKALFAEEVKLKLISYYIICISLPKCDDKYNSAVKSYCRFIKNMLERNSSKANLITLLSKTVLKVE
ncbi:hypothetical protein PAPHI01_1797 [Pancytospora philotis]|nr:hypothetical protein PAPHI01_1797 [Pancytospora philotis]